VLPPKLAPVKAMIIPIYRKDSDRAGVLETAHRIANDLGATVDDREGQTPGAKFFYWERRGVPVVLEFGPRDLASGSVVVKPRDTGAKHSVSLESVGESLHQLLAEMQASMFRAAQQRMKANTVLADSVAEVESILNNVTAERGGGKFVMAHVKDDPRCDVRMKALKATIRCIPLVDEYDGPGKCIVTGEPVERRALIAKAY